MLEAERDYSNTKGIALMMISLQRTTRDAWGFLLPVLVLFTGIFTYLALAAYSLVPVVGTIYAAACWLAPPAAVLLWLFLIAYFYRLVFPISYRTEISSDRVVFRNSAKPHDPLVLQRVDILRFYIKPYHRWHVESAVYPVMYETRWNQTEAISLSFVEDATAQEFLAAIAQEWGPDYLPKPKPPGLLSREIRLWSRKKGDNFYQKLN